MSTPDDALSPGVEPDTDGSPTQPVRASGAAAAPTRREVEEGIAYLHARIGATATRALESASFVYALIELLVERGVLSLDEVDARKREVAPRLLERFERHDPGIATQQSPHDKYAAPVEASIDCASRVPLCKAACCKMVFPLSRQDLAEGVIRWDLGRPYVIAKGDDGYCQHLDRSCLRCTVHPARPLPCRVYDCRHDSRVWVDFERRLVSPKLADPAWPHNLSDAEREAWAQP
jgi:hypothetical protein